MRRQKGARRGVREQERRLSYLRELSELPSIEEQRRRTASQIRSLESMIRETEEASRQYTRRAEELRIEARELERAERETNLRLTSLSCS